MPSVAGAIAGEGGADAAMDYRQPTGFRVMPSLHDEAGVNLTYGGA
jgi:hypothetical protein